MYCLSRCGLDVYEDEPNMTPGLNHCDNVVIVPHIASASLWTRSGMVSLRTAEPARHFPHVTILLTVETRPTVGAQSSRHLFVGGCSSFLL